MIIRTKKNKNFTVVNNTCFRDRTLSARSKGIYGYLMTLPDDWQVHMRELVTHFREGKDALRTAFKELENAGYVEKVRVKGEAGRFTGWEYTIHETPQVCETDPTDILENRMSVNQVVGNPPLLSTDVPSTEGTKEKELPAKQKCSAGEKNSLGKSSKKREDVGHLQDPDSVERSRLIKKLYPLMRDLFSIYRLEVLKQRCDKPEDFYAAFDTAAFVAATPHDEDAKDHKKVRAIITMLIRIPEGCWPRLDAVRACVYNGKTLAAHWDELVLCYHTNALDKTWQLPPQDWKGVMGRYATWK